jgi:Protein of unknown function (DUF1598)
MGAVPRRANRKHANRGPALATAAIAGVLFGGLTFLMSRSPVTASATGQVPGTPTSAESPVDSQPIISARTAATATATTQPQAGAVNRKTRPATDTTVRVAETSALAPTVPRTAADREKLIQAQIATGEFGPALQTARSATDAAERTRLLKTIATAQDAPPIQNGDPQTADVPTSRMSITASRGPARAQISSRPSATGGAAQAAMLVNLIKQTAGDEDDWNEDGPRKQPLYWPPGIEVDPNGLLRGLTHQEQGTTLNALGHRARDADLNTDLRTPSSLRLVSLRQLEQEVSQRLAEGRPIPETMQHLAGLSHIRYVFVDPDRHDVIIGGPAEGWRYNAQGIAVGRESGRAELFLDDLVTVLRTFSPQGPGYFNCQIVPREEGLRQIKQFVEASHARGPIDSTAVNRWTNQLQQQLGLQDVEINGIPADSRVAAVIFEADYRLKLIGIGKLPGGPGIPSVFDLFPKTGEVKSQRMDALRWWLSLKYDAILHSPDRNTFELKGAAVLCQSENEKISAQGQRIHTGKSEAANRMFAANFTAHYSELAAQDPVFVDLQNIFDLSLVAALLADNRIADRIAWNLGCFATDGAYHTAHYQPPQQIMSVVNHRVYDGKDIVVQVAGGIDGRIRDVLHDPQIVRETTTLTGVQTKRRSTELPPEGRWWWDAKSP